MVWVILTKMVYMESEKIKIIRDALKKNEIPKNCFRALHSKTLLIRGLSLYIWYRG